VAELPPEPGSTSNAGWFHDLMLRVTAARNAGDTAEVDRLRDYARREGDAGLAQMVDQLLAAADEAAAAARAGRPMARRSIGANPPGQRICDFCASPNTVAYYPFNEFDLQGPTGTLASGDRMYVCPRCYELVKAGDWKGLRDWVGPAAKTYGTRLLWMGFQRNRTGPAVFFTPGTDPEEGRDQ
jgi:hypothetical protein